MQIPLVGEFAIQPGWTWMGFFWPSEDSGATLGSSLWPHPQEYISPAGNSGTDAYRTNACATQNRLIASWQGHMTTRPLLDRPAGRELHCLPGLSETVVFEPRDRTL